MTIPDQALTEHRYTEENQTDDYSEVKRQIEEAQKALKHAKKELEQ